MVAQSCAGGKELFAESVGISFIGRKQWTCLAEGKALLVACLVARDGGWRGREEDCWRICHVGQKRC